MAMLAAAIGMGAGVLGGAKIGSMLFSDSKPKDFSFLDEKADADDNISPEARAAVSASMRELLPYTARWTHWPDYEHVNMLNLLLSEMWPQVTAAALVEVTKAVKEQIKVQVLDKFPFVEDIYLGEISMSDTNKSSEFVKGRKFHLGDTAFSLGGIKAYDTRDDEVIFEVPLIWGSTCKIDVTAVLRLGPLRLRVPLSIHDLCFKFDTRITVKPLVETIPCVGGLHVTLLEPPHLDLALKLFWGIDLMALPGVRSLTQFGIKTVLSDMLMYPNSLSIPVMPNYGLPKPPVGMLRVGLIKILGAKGMDRPSVELLVRTGRPVASKAAELSRDGELHLNQEFHLIVDDTETQKLTIKVVSMDKTGGWMPSKALAKNKLSFGRKRIPMHSSAGLKPDRSDEKGAEKGKSGEEEGEKFYPAEFIRVPNRTVDMSIPLYKDIKQPMMLTSTINNAIRGSVVGQLFGRGSSKGGMVPADEILADLNKVENLFTTQPGPPTCTLLLKLTFIPFFRPQYDDEDDDEEEGEAAAAKKLAIPQSRQIMTNVPDAIRGVLTVSLNRCLNLSDTGVNTYVKFLIEDPLSDSSADDFQVSSVVLNQCSPRWGDKFDFVMVSAASMLNVAVMGTSAGVGKTKGTDPVLGRLSIPVRDIVRTSYVKDIWTLQETDRGQIEMALTWQTCYVSE